jgi:hypothetical protein
VLSFEIVNDGKAIEIICDPEGIDRLVSELNKLKQVGGHRHLLTPSNGGHELDETTVWGKPAMGEVILSYCLEGN